MILHYKHLAVGKKSLFVESKSEDNIFEMDRSLKNGSNAFISNSIEKNEKVFCPVHKLRTAYKKNIAPKPEENKTINPQKVVYGFIDKHTI